MKKKIDINSSKNESLQKVLLSLVCICFFVFSTNTYAGQLDSLSETSVTSPTEQETEAPVDESNKPLPTKEFRPEIGFGLGHFKFLGDVRSEGSQSSYTNSLVYSAYLARRISKSVDLGLRYSTGVMVGTQNGATDHLNFKTILHDGSIFIGYDFSHLLPEKAVLKPYVSIGLSVFELNSKGDLYDANGNLYHYWADGSIRSIAENNPNASQAQKLQRDYKFETDLRKQDLDGFGIYPQVGFGIPIGLELEFNINSRMSFRLGTIYTYSFNDRLDNVTEESVGVRAGTKGGDHYLQNKLSLHYDLFKGRRKVEPEDFEFVDFLALDTEDEDKDNVINEFDLCPFTIKNVTVDSDGCPMDVDEDGVPDYLDLELVSDLGVDVNELGETLTEDDYLLWYLTFIDSLSVSDEMLERIASKKERLPIYRVFLTEYANGDSIPDAEVNIFLAEKDLSVFNDKEGSTVYTVGKYGSEAKAMERKDSLINKGFSEAEIVVMDRGSVLSADKWKDLARREIKDRFKEETERKASFEYRYAVLLGSTDASASIIEKARYLKDDKVIRFEGRNRSLDYVIGPYVDTVSAKQSLMKAKQAGFKQAKIVRIQDERARPLYALSGDAEKERLDYKRIYDLDGKLVVKVGTVDVYSTFEEQQKFKDDKNLVAIRNGDQTTDYVYPVGYELKVDALKQRDVLIGKGYKQAKVATVLVDKQELKLIIEDDLDEMYTISLGIFTKGVDDKVVNNILSIADVRKLETTNPDRDVYVVGKFKSKDASKTRLRQLIKAGYQPEVVRYEEGKVIPVDASDILSPEELAQIAKNKKGSVYTDEAVFRVQVGAFSKKIPLTKFKGQDVVDFREGDGMWKYVSVGKKSYRDIFIEKLDLEKIGFTDAFIVAFKDGKKVNVKNLVSDEEYKRVNNEFSGVKQGTVELPEVPVVAGIRYKVQVGAFKNIDAQRSKLSKYPSSEIEVYGEYKRVLVGSYETYEEAASLKEKLKQSDFPGAFVVAYEDGKKIKIANKNSQVVTPEVDVEDDVSKLDKELHFMIQIGVYRGALPAEVENKFSTLDKVTKELRPQGIVRYLAGDYNIPDEARAFKDELVAQGFEGVFLVAYYDSERITVKEALEIFKNK